MLESWCNRECTFIAQNIYVSWKIWLYIDSIKREIIRDWFRVIWVMVIKSSMINEFRFFLLFLMESFFSFFLCLPGFFLLFVSVVVIMLFCWGVLPFAERQPGIHATMTDHHHQECEVLAISTSIEQKSWKSLDMTAQHIWLLLTLPLHNQPQFSSFLFFLLFSSSLY